MSEITLLIKPILFTDLKTEISLVLKDDATLLDVCTILSTQYLCDVGNPVFLFRGKKLKNDVKLSELGIKDKSKLMMQKTSQQPQAPQQPKISSKESALQVLLHKYQDEQKKKVIEEYITSLPGINSMSQEEIVSKIETLIEIRFPKELPEMSFEIKDQYINLNDINLTSVFAYGNGIRGQLGIGTYIKVPNIIRVNTLRSIKIAKIACGLSHTVALTDSSAVYSWGKFFKPLSGSSLSTEGDYPTPVLIESLSNQCIIDISCGSNHSIAINDVGEVFTWGEGIYGQLGHDKYDNEMYPRKLKIDAKISQARGGAMHTVCITREGYLIGFGNNEKKQLNLKGKKSVVTPMILPIYEFNEVYDVDELKIIQDDKDIKLEGIETVTLIVEELMKVKLVTCGMWFTAFVSLLFPANLYIIGEMNKTVIKVKYFSRIKEEIKQIEANSSLLYVLTNNHKLYCLDVKDIMSKKGEYEMTKIEGIDLVEKFGVTFDDLVYITKEKSCMKYSLKTKEKLLVNNEIMCDVEDVQCGAEHAFFLTNLNRNDYNDILYNQIKDNKTTDYDLKIKNAIRTHYCHSFIVNQFINKNSLEEIQVDLSENETTLLLQLMYKGKIVEKNYLDYDQILESVNSLKAIKEYLTENSRQNEVSELLKEIVEMYIDKHKRSLQQMNPDEKQKEKINEIYKEMLQKTYREVLRVSFIRGQKDENKNKEEEKKIIEANKPESQVIQGESKENTQINLESFHKFQTELEHSYKFYNKLSEKTKKIQELKKKEISENIPDKFAFSIRLQDDTVIKINKFLVTIKSLYLKNVSLFSKEFPVVKSPLKEVDGSIVKVIAEYIKNSECRIEPKEIFTYLELSNYFLIDNLHELLEIVLEESLTIPNIPAFFQIAKDLDLNLFYRKCLVFAAAHLSEMKAKGIYKYIQAEEREQLKTLLTLNKIK